jgi:hypothetical protein
MEPPPEKSKGHFGFRGTGQTYSIASRHPIAD